jgi:hypothetical protein
MRSEQRKENRSKQWEKEENGTENKKIEKTMEHRGRYGKEKKNIRPRKRKKENYCREVKWTGESGKEGTKRRKNKKNIINYK